MFHDHIGQLGDTGQIDYVHYLIEGRDVGDVNGSREWNYAGR